MQAEKYIATVDGEAEFEITANSVSQLDLVSIGEGHFHLIHKGTSYRAELISLNKLAKEITLNINGKVRVVNIQDGYDQLVKKMGLSANIIHKISSINAPMPGLVLSILVEPGQEVVHGEPMLILEAMKMENVIKSPGEGKVKRVVISKGKPVEKGEILIEME